MSDKPELSPDDFRLLAKQVEATTVLLRGKFEEGRRLLDDLGVFCAAEEKTALEAARAHLLAFSMGSFVLWLTGEPDRALRRTVRTSRPRTDVVAESPF